MGSAVVSLMAFAIVIAVSFTVLGDVMSLGASSAESLSATWEQAETLVDSHARAVSAEPTTAAVTDVDVVIENTGRAKFAPPEFPQWEVIVRYEDSTGEQTVEYAAYSDAPGAGMWNVEQIYLDEPSAAAEVYEPGILNSGEEMVINVRLLRLLGSGTTNMVTVVTPSGESSSVIFEG